jgi:hypothetical protein
MTTQQRLALVVFLSSALFTGLAFMGWQMGGLVAALLAASMGVPYAAIMYYWIRQGH